MKLFSSTWCAPCKIAKDIIKTNNIKGIEMFDIDKDIEKTQEFKVRGIPTLILDNNTVLVGEKVINYLRGLK